MNLIFVRHGETGQNALGMQGTAEHDANLNALGRQQAEQAAGKCADYKPIAIYTSPYKRAVETADIIAERTGVHINVADNLKEINVGAWGSLTGDKLRETMKAVGVWGWTDKKYTFRPPGGESFADIEQRIRQLIEPLLRDNDETIIFVTHSGILKVVESWMGSRTLEETLPLRYPTGACLGYTYDGKKFQELLKTEEAVRDL